MKVLIKLFFLLFFSPTFGQNNTSLDSLFDCKFRIRWATDSNGLRGTRYQLTREVFLDKRGRSKSAILEGISEDSLVEYLGKPNIFSKSLNDDGYNQFTYFIKMDWIKSDSYEGVVLIVKSFRNKVVYYFVMIT
jgi:hypothetical protein